MLSQSVGLLLGPCSIPPVYAVPSCSSDTTFIRQSDLRSGASLLALWTQAFFFFFLLVGFSAWGFQSFTDWSICWPAALPVAGRDCPFSSRPLLLDSLLPDSELFSCLSVSLTSSALPSVGLRVSEPVFSPLPTFPQGSGPKPQQLPEAPPLCLLHPPAGLLKTPVSKMGPAL